MSGDDYPYCVVCSHILKHNLRYEYTLVVTFLPIGWLMSKMVLQTFYFTNIEYLQNLKDLMLIYGIMAMVHFILDASYHFIYTEYFGYFPPKPFGGFTVGTIMLPITFVTIWFRYGPLMK